MDMSDIKKILIIRLSALGDTIHTLPLAVAIKNQYPNIQLDWVVEDNASKFIINNPLINNVYEIRKQHRREDYIKIIKAIRNQHYDIAIDTQQLLKSAVILGLSDAKRKITLDGGREFSFLFSNEIIKTKRKPFDINYHVVKRNLEIAKYLGCNNFEIQFVTPNFNNEISENIKEIINKIDKTKNTIVIAPATTWKNKHWKNEYWCEVINELKNDFNIIITASQKEKTLISEILSNVEINTNIYDLTGMTSLCDLSYIYKNADMVISPDSGSAHIAWATGHPYILTLFFSTSANRTAPFGDKYFSLSAKVSCSPCMKRKCRNKKCYMSCTETIKPYEIINIVKNVLQSK